MTTDIFASGSKAAPQRRHFCERSGTLEVRLARSSDEVAAAQRLRFQVFFEEMGAIASKSAALAGLDHDGLDPFCDHLLVIDRAGAGKRIVGTYRLLGQETAETHGGFYSAREYDIARLIQRHPTKTFLEVGRSCVHPDYRKKRTIELLWQGLWTYIRLHRYDAMFGCASLPGTDPTNFAKALRLIADEASAPAAWQVPGLERVSVPAALHAAHDCEPRKALKTLPPLIKAYLRLGAYFSDDLFIDHDFQTTDYLVTLPVERIRSRYFAKFGQPDVYESDRAQPLMS